MATVLPAIPFYLGSGPDTVLCLLQPAAARSRGAAVLICAPWGWDEVSSYRSRRGWAEQLAAAGHPTLRFDLPASGDSGGMPADPDRLDAWVEATAAAATLLREEGGAPRLAVLGLGLGGLLAREALARGAPIEEIVLWGDPVKGSSFAREQRAFSRLQDGRPLDENGEPAPSPLPQGWLESGGFVLSAETLASLKALDPRLPSPSPLRRALLLDRDGIEPDQGLRTELEAAGVAVSVAPGEGWGELVGHPERTRLVPATAERVSAWLREPEEVAAETPGAGAPEAPAGSPPASRPQRPAALEIEAGGARLRETPLALPQRFGNAFGVLTEPVGGAATDLCAVFLNAGAIRHSGPNRLWTEAARRWAARGVPTLRVDLEGIGEADGDEGKFSDTGSFYRPEFDEQVDALLDSLQERGLGGRFLLSGLCAGSYWSFRAALQDPRVEAALLLNGGALVWHDDLMQQRQARKLERLWQPSWWWKALRGQFSLVRLWFFVRLGAAKAAKAARRLARALPGGGGASAPAGSSIDADLDRIRDRGVELTLAFSAQEPLHTELEAKGILGQLERWPNLRLVDLPGSDHTLRSAAAQIAVRELLDGELERALAAQPGSASPAQGAAAGRQR
jgi:alpha-beta hydrolase superfamily lysophospholipase